MVRPRSCRVIYYFDTLALGIRHQSFDHVSADNTNILLTFLLGLVWLHANLLILQSLLRKLPYCQIIYFLTLHDFIKSWVFFNILPSFAQIFVLLLTEFVSLCMLLHILIGSPLNVLYATLKVWHLMVFILLIVPPLIYMIMDVDWAGSIDDRKSMGGYLIFFDQTPISWKSGKQHTIARSSTEAKYKALADDIVKVI